MPKTKATDWKSRPIAEWVPKTFQTYLADQYKEKYGTKYVTNSYGFEGKKLKEMLAEHDNETIKRFIDTCYREYRPTAKWPTVNFAGMYTFMRTQVLPKVLLAQRAEKLLGAELPIEKTEDSESLKSIEW
jgi:hypothetical protein